MRFRWVLWIPLAMGVVLAAILGLRAGLESGPVSETEVIEAWAAHYVAETPGAALTDCHAVPGGAEPVWLVVVCGAEARTFPVDRAGRLVGPGGEPQT